MKSTKSQCLERDSQIPMEQMKRQSSSIEANVENARDGLSSSPLVYNASKMKPTVSLHPPLSSWFPSTSFSQTP